LDSTVNAPLYTTDILRLAASLRAPCELEREDGRAEVRSPTCGSTVSLAVQLDSAGRVEAVSQTVHACAFGQAAAALMERSAIGRSHADAAQALVGLSAWLAREHDDAGVWPGLTALAPARSRSARHGAILLPFRALLAALETRR
jgi:NifU-like protein involved in Fe-S cluster formation